MLATFTMIGRIAEKPVVLKTDGLSDCRLILETERPFRTQDGNAVTDRFEIAVWRGIALECGASCSSGSLVVVSGRLESGSDRNNPVPRLIAEKISCIKDPDTE